MREGIHGGEYFNGQVLAEKDNTGSWTDHIYANGKRLATVRPTTVLHHTGKCRDGSCSSGWSNFTVPQLGISLQGYTIRAGDRLVFQQRQGNARAGLYLLATDGANSMGTLAAKNATPNQGSTTSGLGTTPATWDGG